MSDPTRDTRTQIDRHHFILAFGNDHGARVVRHLREVHGVEAPPENTAEARTARTRLHYEAHGCTISDDGRITFPADADLAAALAEARAETSRLRGLLVEAVQGWVVEATIACTNHGNPPCRRKGCDCTYDADRVRRAGGIVVAADRAEGADRA